MVYHKKIGYIEGKFDKILSPRLARFKNSGGIIYIQIKTDNIILDNFAGLKVYDSGKKLGSYRLLKMVGYRNVRLQKFLKFTSSRKIKAWTESDILQRESTNAVCQTAKHKTAGLFATLENRKAEATADIRGHSRHTHKKRLSRNQALKPLANLIKDDKIWEIKELNDFTDIIGRVGPSKKGTKLEYKRRGSRKRKYERTENKTI